MSGISGVTSTSAVTMQAPWGASYDLAVGWTEVGGERRLLAVLGSADLAALDTDELFHLAPAARPASLALQPGLPAALELRPDDALDDVPEGESAAAWLLARPDRLATDRWFVAALSQPDAGTPVRVRTLWDYADAVGPDADPTATVDAATRFLTDEHPELFGGLAETGGLSALLGTVLGTPPEVDPLPSFEALLVASEAEFTRLESGTLAFPASGRWGSWICLAETSRFAGSLVLYGLLPMEVDLARLTDAWELVGRFNADRVTGTVQLDAATGRTVLRTSLILDTAPSRAVLKRALDLNIEAMDEALPVFERFAAGASVAAALAD